MTTKPWKDKSPIDIINNKTAKYEKKKRASW